jgi:CBS domain-containing protein
MLRKIAVGDIMTRNLVAVKPSSDLKVCAKELVKQRVNTLLVTDNKKLVGILTSRDILWAMIKKPNLQLKDIKVVDVASRKVAVIKPSSDIGQAFQKMKKFGFRRLPVLSKGEIVGILTLRDILRVDPSLYREVGDLMSIREEMDKIQGLTGIEESEGLCDECGSLSNLLKTAGRMICADCKEELY